MMVMKVKKSAEQVVVHPYCKVLLLIFAHVLHLKGRHHIEDLGINQKVTLRLILK
jgi:hypothetical protein